MNHRILFSADARVELEKSILWYNNQRSGLGFEFEAEVYEMCERLHENPQRYRMVGKSIRMARLKRFNKFAIYFHVETDFTGVVAVFNAKRDPGDLSRRLA